MDKFLDGTVNFDLYDYTGEYVPLYRYYRYNPLSLVEWREVINFVI